MNAVMPDLMTMTADEAAVLHKKMLAATEDMGEIVSAKRMLEDQDAPRAPVLPVIEEDPETAAAFEAIVARLEVASNDDVLEPASLGILPIDWPSFWKREPPDEEWTIRPVVPKGRQVALYAEAKLGKSLLGLDAAAAAATGRSIFGQEPCEPITVVYIDMEMTLDDLYERLEDLGYGPESDLSRLAYYQLQSMPPLDDVEGGDVLMGIVRHHRADLVVLDTMARVVVGEENSADTYRDFYRHTGRRLKQAGVSLWRFDHVGKDPTAGQRGSSAKGNDVDVVFRATLVDNKIVLKRTHTRVPWVPATVALTREINPHLRHVLGDDAWPAGTKEVADLLDKLSVPLDATRRSAEQILRANECGRRGTVIIAALRFRRLLSET